jgi:hypothetical protein
MAHDFNEGLAIVTLLPSTISRDTPISTPRYSVINQKGEILFNPPFGIVGSFSEGLAAVETTVSKVMKWGFIDTTGRVAIPPQFDSALHFKEGFAPVKVNEHYGFIDKTGKIVIEPKYTSVGWVSNGLAAVRVEKKWGYIYTNGNIAIKPMFDRVGFCFCDTISSVWIGKKLGYIDRTGKYIWQPQN